MSRLKRRMFKLLVHSGHRFLTHFSGGERGTAGGVFEHTGRDVVGGRDADNRGLRRRVSHHPDRKIHRGHYRDSGDRTVRPARWSSRVRICRGHAQTGEQQVLLPSLQQGDCEAIVGHASDV